MDFSSGRKSGSLFGDLELSTHRVSQGTQKKVSRRRRALRGLSVDELNEVLDSKKITEYNTLDFEILFSLLWLSKGFQGSVFSWSLKEKKLVKLLIDDCSPEALHSMFLYLFDNWESIKKRYKITGVPTPSLIYGYRQNFLTDSIQKPKLNSKNFGAEWSETKESLPDDDWWGSV